MSQPDHQTPEERARHWLTGERGLVLGMHTNVGAQGLVCYLAAYQRYLIAQHADAIRQAEAAAYERGRAAGQETCAAHLERLDRIGTTPANKTPMADKETWAAAFLHFRGPMSSVMPPFKQMAALIRDIPADAIRARSTTEPQP